jgi:Fur family peroxide stress response transcriptional regulator
LEHPTAQEAYAYITGAGVLRAEDRISLGTIYRNLQVLEEEGRVAAVPTGQDAMRYDARLDTHYHMLCKNCGSIFDVPIRYIKDIDLEAERHSGYQIDSHDIMFRGVCKSCCKKGN